MEQHTKIIEFFGLPGCGKSTLENFLIEEESADTWLFCKMSDLTTKYRKTSFLFKIKNFPYKTFFILFLLLCKLPLVSFNNLRIYGGFFRIVLAYSYAKNTYSTSYVVIDHGIIQSIVSVLYGHSQYNLKNCKKSLSWLADCFCDVSYYFCSIDPSECLKRLRQRNRKNSGRLDSICDDVSLLHNLSIQKKQFEILASYLQNTTVLDMQRETVEIAKDLLYQIKENA